MNTTAIAKFCSLLIVISSVSCQLVKSKANQQQEISRRGSIIITAPSAQYPQMTPMPGFPGNFQLPPGAVPYPVPVPIPVPVPVPAHFPAHSQVAHGHHPQQHHHQQHHHQSHHQQHHHQPAVYPIYTPDHGQHEYHHHGQQLAHLEHDGGHYGDSQYGGDWAQASFNHHSLSHEPFWSEWLN